MRLIGLAVILALGLALTPLAIEAQQKGKVWRVGVLFTQERGRDNPYFESMLRGFQDLGYVEGKNLTIEFRSAEGEVARLHDLAVDLVQARVDLIIASGTRGTSAAMKSTRTIPIVMAGALYPEERQFVASIAHPGGNVTGIVAAFDRAFFGKALEILKEAVPKASRVALLQTSPPPSGSALHPATVDMSRRLGLTLVPVFVDRIEQLPDALAMARRERADTLFADATVTVLLRHEIVAFADKYRLPLISGSRLLVEAGGLLSYGPNIFDIFRRAPIFADRIFKGAKPADIAVEQPTKLELVINLKTAKALGLTIPQTILLQAAQVIE